MTIIQHISKSLFIACSGLAGWFVAHFAPTFPLVFIMIASVYYDVWSAYLLSKRVAERYPDLAKEKNPKFTSFAFGKPLRITIPQLFAGILLVHSVDVWVWTFHNLHLANIATSAICGWHFWSVIENSSSCVDEKASRMWAVLKRIVVDKTYRHLNVDISALMNSKEQ